MRMSQKIAQNIVLGMMIVAIAFAVVRTFIDPDLVGVLTGILSASILYWAYRNPRMLLTKNMDEFGPIYDNSRDKKFLVGFPLFHLLTLSVILYIWMRL